jgi:hypothetical protein
MSTVILPLLGILCAVASFDVTANPADLRQGQAYNNPRVFALTLAQNDVPVGIVIPAEFLRGGKGMPHPEITADSKAAFRIDLAARLDVFNADKGTFRASQGENGVVHIRSINEPMEVTRALEHYSYAEPAVRLSALAVAFRHGVEGMRGYRPQAIAGSGVQPTPGPECPIDDPVEFAGGSTTAMGVLDQIVHQVPGIVWLVTYRQVPTSPLEVNLGLLCTNGGYFTISVFP